MNTEFRSLPQGDGYFRIIAKSQQNMTHLVCECENKALADYLIDEFSAMTEDVKRHILQSISKRSNAVKDAKADIEEEQYFERMSA